TSLMLIAVSALTSAVTASLGIGGGVLLLAVMAVALPPAAIIPVHGMVQLGSKISRASMTLRRINLRLVRAFAPGAVLGAWLGSLFLVELPLALVQLCIAAFILRLCWRPRVPRIATSAVGILAAAAITRFCGVFVGATG